MWKNVGACAGVHKFKEVRLQGLFFCRGESLVWWVEPLANWNNRITALSRPRNCTAASGSVMLQLENLQLTPLQLITGLGSFRGLREKKQTILWVSNIIFIAAVLSAAATKISAAVGCQGKGALGFLKGCNWHRCYFQLVIHSNELTGLIPQAKDLNVALRESKF